MSYTNSHHIQGDFVGINRASDFDFSTVLTRDDLLELYLVNDVIDKACHWLPQQAFVNGFQFLTDQAFSGYKHNVPFLFPSFYQWLEWTGSLEEIIAAISWSELFGKSILVGFTEADNPLQIMFKEEKITSYPAINSHQTPATKLLAIHPYCNGNGFKVAAIDPLTGQPSQYKIYYVNREQYDYETNIENTPTTFTYLVDASRVVKFHSTRKQMGVEGTSAVYTSAHMAKSLQILIESVTTIAKNLSASYLVIKAKSKTEAQEITESLGSAFDYTSKLAYVGPEKDIPDMIQHVVPDLNSSQLLDLTLLIKKQLASATNLSLRAFGEEDIAAGIGEGGTAFSHLLMKAKIQQIQHHYHRMIEEAFYLMGKAETSFVWNDPLLKDETLSNEVTTDAQKENPPDQRSNSDDRERIERQDTASETESGSL